MNSMKNHEEFSLSPSKQTPETPSTGDTQINSSETAPTQEMHTQDCSSQDEVDEAHQPWGRLFPLGNTSIESLDLKRDKEVYHFGRGSQCDFVFSSDFKDHQSISKTHFSLYLQNTNSGEFPFIEDKSSNGTYINGDRVGKGNKQHLQNNDVIAVCYPTSKVFVYMDNANSESDKFAPQVTEKYTISKTLGRGACGEVKLAFKKNTSEPVAIKIIQKKKFSTRGTQMNSAAQIQREVNIMRALKHPCIIAIYDVIDTSDAVYIVLELVQGGELFDRIIACKVLDEHTAKFYFFQMVLAIKYLHDQGISHRDLKLENVLLSDNSQEALVKITDFGLAKFIDGGSMLKTFCGTPNYLAPEILQNAGRGSYTNAVDCWSLGVILYSILGGYPPFTGDRKDMKLAHQIVKGSYSFPNQFWKGVSPTAIDLIKRLLTVDYTKRITIAECLGHKWLKDKLVINKATKLMQSATSGTPSKRNSMPPPRGSAIKRRRLENDVMNNNEGSTTPSTTCMDVTGNQGNFS